MNYATLKSQASDYLNQCQYDEAQILYQQCIELEPEPRDNYWYLGLTYLLQEDSEAAEEVWLSLLLTASLDEYDHWLEELKNIFIETASYYHQTGYLSTARFIFEKMIDQFPEQGEHYYNLGSVIADQGELDLAINCYRKAINLSPEQALYYASLGEVLTEQGHYVEGYSYLWQALELEPDNSLYKKWWAITLRSILFEQADSTIIARIIDCFQQPDINKNNLMNPSLSLLKLTSEFQTIAHWCQSGLESLADHYCQNDGLAFFTHQLGQYLLSSTLIANLETEKILTSIRQIILLNFDDPKSSENLVLPFVCALAHQCFNNEYAFQVTEKEQEKVNALQIKIETLLATLDVNNFDRDELEIILAIFSLYSPLSKLKNAHQLLLPKPDQWSVYFYTLLEQTLIHYYREKELAKNVDILTKVEEKVSRLVQAQYEENPYPRWLGITVLPPKPITAILGRLFPYFEVPTQFINRKLEVLIAGCGTGAEAISTAINYRNVNILAIDISSNSLAYAMRMAERYQLQNITFQQGDILALSTLNRKFDLIFSTGVIHHLAQPLIGLKILTDLLTPSGLIKLGLYSKKARRSIQMARELIATYHYQSTPEDLRKCRQEIIKLASSENKEWAQELVSQYDFYSLSNCRDLIFHVCEHCFTLLELKKIIEDFSLNFIGLEVNPSTRHLYQTLFPEDSTLNQLEKWHQLEEAHPLTFISMYNFWCQK